MAKTKDMKYFKVSISIQDDENIVENTFEVEATSFDEAVENLERDLDVSLR